MRLLLLNNNPAVSRLIKLSVDKVGYELDEFEDYGLIPLKNYDVIMVDNESYDELELANICEQRECNYILYISQRGSKKPELANAALEKPFLPTDFLALLEKIKNVLKSLAPSQEKVEEIDVSEDEIEENVAKNSFEIDDIDALMIEEEPLLFNDEESSEMPLSDGIKEDMEEDLNLPTFDLDNTKDNALDLSFDDEIEPFTEGAEDENNDEPVALLETEDEEESILSILDKDDINEVKQLLDESDETFSFGEEELENEVESLFEDKEAKDSFETEEELEDDAFAPEEPAIDETPINREENELIAIADEEKEALVLKSDDTIEEEMLNTFKDELSIDEEDETLNEEVQAIEERDKKETKYPFEEASEGEMDETNEDVLPVKEHEEPREEVQIPATKVDFMSLDDLDEKSIKRAFGEEVDESEEIEEQNDTLEEGLVSEKDEKKDTEVIRGEIENTIARSLSGLAQSDVLREALRGMRINISITFDEKTDCER